MQQHFVRELVHQCIIGGLAGALVVSIWWLITGETPSVFVVWGGTAVLCVGVPQLHKMRQQREAQRLTEAFERPAYGEDRNGER